MRFRQFDRRSRMLAQRAWTPRERRAVWRGVTGRAAIAIEPLLGLILFSFFTWGIVWRSQHVANDRSIIVLAPIFALGAAAFLVYTIAVMVRPIIAYLQTRRPIYIVDGYVRYRGPDDYSDLDSTGYIAALFEDRAVACEWECFGATRLPSLTIPALLEFSEYGGIHTIDGRSTGVIPDTEIPLLAVGMNQRH